MSPSAATQNYFLVPSASHAIKGEAALNRAGVSSSLVPVPQTLSSQCGVCLRVSLGDREHAREVLGAAGLPISAVHDLEAKRPRVQTPRDQTPKKDHWQRGRYMNAHPADVEPHHPQEGGRDAGKGPLVVAISGDAMGRGDDELGRVLLRNHLHVLTEIRPRPEALIFFSSGVRLAVGGSPAVDDLGALAARGTRILLCGTCLAHFGLKDKVAVGEISKTFTISETMLRAGEVINL